MPNIVKSPCEVVHVIKHNAQLSTLELKPLRRLTRYSPGHFLHLALDEYDPSQAWPESRVFSIANYDPALSKIRITYGVKGKFTQKMYDSIGVGDRLWIKLPYGDFLFKCHTRNMVLIAGGTGITPFVSFLDSLNVNNSLEIDSCVLHYGTSNYETMLYEKEIDLASKTIPGFTAYKYLEAPSSKGDYIAGKLSVEKIYADSKQRGDCDYFISGPHEMILSFVDYLTQSGIDEKLIHIDNW